MRMMKKIAVLAIISMSMWSCEGGRFETKVSQLGDDESHNAGQNCMACHTKGGEGEGWFAVAGTVYDSSLAAVYPNAMVNLYTGPNGTGDLKYTIEVDVKGNFYTTENIKFNEALYPSITGNTGSKYMSTSITTGNCIACHSVTTDVLRTE
jgi:hypothetical protein